MSRLPALFVGHGSPMNALADNEYTRAWRKLGDELREDTRAVLMISAHWYTQNFPPQITATAEPETIYDFYGFPDELFQVKYPAPGNPDLAGEVKRALDRFDAGLDLERGLDHGAWSVLIHMLPDAQIPCLQLSYDMMAPFEYHLEIGAALTALRDQGVLIVGSGNIVHNLRQIVWRGEPEPFDWATRFDEAVRDKLAGGEWSALKSAQFYENLGEAATMSVPTPDHYIPLLYVLGTAHPGESVTFPCEGMQNASISMRSVRFG